jgi:hypothetical protein
MISPIEGFRVKCIWTKSRMVVARGLGRGNKKLVFNGDRDLAGKDEKVDIYTTM